MMRGSNEATPVGERWDHFRDILQRYMDSGNANDFEERFCRQNLERLETYEDRCIMSLRQINVCNELETKLETPGFLRQRNR